MDDKKLKDLGILNYILLAAAVVHFILAIPATVLSFRFGVLVLIWSMILFLLAVLLPNFESFVKTVYVEKKSAAAEKPAPAQELKEDKERQENAEKREFPYEIIKYRVAGVTFYNGHVSRQSIIRHVHFNDEPCFHDYDCIIREYEYEGDPAIGVYVTYADEDGVICARQIGNIPADSVDEVLERIDRFDRVSALDTYGGRGKNWGATVFLRFWKEGIEHEPADLTHEGICFEPKKKQNKITETE